MADMAPLKVSVQRPTEGQRNLCLAQGCECNPLSEQDKVGVALSTLGRAPINGVRHPITSGDSGWYIWCGEDLSDEPEFFQPSCVVHLLERLPAVADFLALPP